MPVLTPGGRALGRIRDLEDFRDFRFTAPAPTPAIALPPSVDLRPQLPPIDDQGPLGSCTAWASTAAWRHVLMKEGQPDMPVSALAQYYWTRQMEGTTKVDAGASIRDAIKTMVKTGVAPQDLWPYDPHKFATKPPVTVQREASRHQALTYERVTQSLTQMQTVLFSGYIIVFGFAVYESFESPEVAESGITPMPQPSEAMLGGHAVTMVGYNDEVRRVLCRNQWGQHWGQDGYFEMPYEYVMNSGLSSDFWVVRSVEMA
jgi:C1A family cysteine protease